MTKEDLLPGGVTQKQINHWKAQYPAVFEIIVKTDDEDPTKQVHGYFRKPDLKVLQASSAFIDSDPLKSGLIQLENCFLGGDDAFKTNDEVRVSAIQALNRLFRIRLAEIKNL